MLLPKRWRGGGGTLRDETIGLLAQFSTRELIPLEYISQTIVYLYIQLQLVAQLFSGFGVGK